jgi:uncharacterized membrane protein
VGLEAGAEDVPSSLTVNTPNRISELGPGEVRRFSLRINANPGANPETDTLYLRAASDEVRTNKQPITITITKSNTWIGAGIAIALLAILAFGYIVWKYGRR